ncbi:MAG: sugar phosphate isomerase/epimerase [Clostridia bacterium]|nr:sugar phosphate isomerase/epimerase [Clostridia bacterium]
MNSFKIGLCSVTFRKKSVDEVVKIAEKADIRFIEWGGDIHVKTVEDARRVKELCDNSDIKICSYGSYFNCIEYDENKWLEICKIAKEMCADSIRVWLGKKDSEITTRDEYNILVSNSKKMCDIASQYNLTVCPECHDNTFNNNTDAFLKISKDINKANFKTYFQSRYCRMEYDTDRIFRTYPYIKDVHISYRDLNREQYFKKKNPDYLDTLLKKFRSMNFDGIVMIEFVRYNSENQLLIDAEKLRSY